MKRVRLNIPYNLDSDTIVDIFQTDHEIVSKIGSEIDAQLKQNPSVNNIVKYCVNKYKDIELLLALMLVWNICILDYHMQRELDMALKVAQCGGRTPEEIM